MRSGIRGHLKVYKNLMVPGTIKKKCSERIMQERSAFRGFKMRHQLKLVQVQPVHAVDLVFNLLILADSCCDISVQSFI